MKWTKELAKKLLSCLPEEVNKPRYGILSYAIPAITGLIACMPFVPLRITAQGPHWPWLITTLSLFGVLTLFIRTTWFIRSLAVGGLALCFFSRAPYLSFNAYFLLLASCYFLIAASYMRSWEPTFVMLKTLLVLHSMLLCFQFLGQDRLLNFGLVEITQYGIIGSHMQEASFLVILSALLIQRHPAFIIVPFVGAFLCNSTWAVFCVAAGAWTLSTSKHKYWLAGLLLVVFILMGVGTGKFAANLAGNNRLSVWCSTLLLAFQEPWTGWGPATYKYIFPALGGVRGKMWTSAHNDWLQLLFETGYIATSYLTFCSCWLLVKLKHHRVMLAGLIIIFCDMWVHFPLRTFQVLPLVLLFFAYCFDQIKKREGGEAAPSLFL